VRKAKEFIWLGKVWTAEEMHEMGFVMKVVPLADFEAETMAIARQVANLPPWATRLTKKTLNHAADLMGKRQYWEYHFLMHELVHLTEEARDMKKLREGLPTQGWVRMLRDRVGYPHPQTVGREQSANGNGKMRVLEASEAPPRPAHHSRLAERMARNESFVTSLVKGQTGVVEPEGSETARGLSLQMSRAAKRLQVPVETWIVENKVYVERK
jgi:hypothetical protein